MLVEDWGPRETELGVGANCQPDGSSAIWILAKQVDKLSINRVRFGNYIWRPANIVGSDVVTSIVPDCVINTPGRHPVFLVDVNNKAIFVGIFKTIPARRKSFQFRNLWASRAVSTHKATDS